MARLSSYDQAWSNGAKGCYRQCFKAIIDNLCPECASGDLDMGQDNGGRWPLEWKFIDCPSSPLQLKTEGGNKWCAPVVGMSLALFHLDAENHTQQFLISLSVSDTVVVTVMRTFLEPWTDSRAELWGQNPQK